MGLSSKLVWLIPAAMLVGLGIGVSFDVSFLSQLVLPLTMLMVYPMLITFKPREALSMADGKAMGIAMGLNFLVLPLIAAGLAHLFFPNQPALFVGMILAGLFPTSGMTISWTGFAKGNVTAAIKMTVVGLILASLLAPLYLLGLAGAVVPVDLVQVLITIVLVVFVPMIAASLTRAALLKKMAPPQFKKLGPLFSGVSTIGVLLIVAVAIALKASMIVKNPALVAWVLVPLVIFYALNYVIAFVLGKLFLNRGDSIAVIYGTVMRNLSIALGLAVTNFGPESALVLAAAYIIQVQSAAWSVKLASRIFGPAPN